MDRLEEQLRAVLTDDRLDVRLAPGAVQAVHDGVRRRKRRNAALSVAASVALVVGGIAGGVALTQGGRASVEPGQNNATSPPPASGGPKQVQPATDAVPWNPIRYDPAKPFALAGTAPATGVPWCDATQLTLAPSQFQGATGSAAGGLTVKNGGGVCGLQGAPVLTGYGNGDKGVATSTPNDPFLVHPWLELQHGQRAVTNVQIFGDGSRCLGPVKRLSVALGHGSRPVTVDVSWVTGGEVLPRCGTAAPGQQLDHYTISTSEWSRPDGTPTLAMRQFTATIWQQPPAVMQGATVRFQVLLSTQGIRIDPCLPYREQLVSLDGAHTFATQYYLLDCQAMADTPELSYRLDMELPLPRDIPPGRYLIQWQTPLPGLQVDAGPDLEVTAAPAPCQVSQLSLRAGAGGAATGHYAEDVVLTNTSRSACTLRGYPGVQFVDANGHALPTKDNWTTSAFMWQYTGYETVRLAPGGQARFTLGGVDYDFVHQRQCPAAPVVKVIPPGLSQQIPVQVSWPYCLDGKVDVSPVLGGAARR